MSEDSGNEGGNLEDFLSTSAKQRRCPTTSESSTDSPEKSHPKRSKPNPVTPTKAINIRGGGSSLSTSAGPSSLPSLDEKLPLWVAGASPAKFVALEDVIKINNSIEKMAIVHEIAVDPKFSVEDLQRKDTVYDAVKKNMHKAYWDMLSAEMAKTPPNLNLAFQLLKDLKQVITEQFAASNLNNALSAIHEILDLEHLKSMLDQRTLDFREVLAMLLQVLQRLCAPVRDEMVQRLKREENLVDLFRGMFELVEFMEIDMANFALSQNRGTIENYSAQIEREEFMKALEIEPTGAHFTHLWLRRILQIYLAERQASPAVAGGIQNRPTDTLGDVLLSSSEITELIIAFYLTLLEMNPNSEEGGDGGENGRLSCADLLHHFPETLKLDEQRFLALGEKFLQLELVTAAIFVTSNLAGKRACELPAFKTTLKNELIVILNDVSWSNHVEKLDNIFLQCEKNVKGLSAETASWSEEKSALLKEQIHNLKSPQNSIRTIARTRIHSFLQLVLRRSGEPLKLPPGLGSIQSELAAFTAKLYAIVVHNWNAFGAFYADILKEAYLERK